MRTVIVGDIHGCMLELKSLLSAVKLSISTDRLILLGDIIDRGPDSCGAYLYVCELKELMGERCIVIRGNHENMFCHDYKLPSSHWRYTWGKETLQSFSDGGVASEDVANWIRKNTVLYFESDLFQCTHGGLFHSNLSKNDEEILIWDRTAITTNSYTGKLTIIGHTPLQVASYGDGSMGPLQKIKYNRWNVLPETGIIDIDTGCFTENCLTAMIIEDSKFKLVRQYPVYE